MSASLPTILHLNTRSDAGGAAVAVRTLHTELNALGEVHSSLLAGRGISDPAHGFHTLANGRFRFLANVLAFRLLGLEGACNHAAWRRARPTIAAADLLHLHNAHGYYLPLGLLRQLLQRPLVWTLHDHWLATGRSGWLPDGVPASPLERLLPWYGGGYPVEWWDRSRQRRAVLWRLLSAAGSRLRLVCPSAAQRERMLATGLPVSRIDVIPLGLFGDEAAPQAEQRAAARAQLGLAGEGRRIALFAALRLDEERKGWSVLEQALARTADPASWLVIACGERGRRPDRWVTERGSEIRCPGLLPKGELIQYFQAADLFVNPSFQETFGLTNIEAAGEGTAVVCSDLPVFHETMGEWATYVAPGQVAALAAALDGPAPVAGPALAAAVRQRYARATMAARYTEIYRELLAMHGGRQARGDLG